MRILALDQESFDYFFTTYGQQIRVIHIHRCPAVRDWSVLGTLPDLEFLSVFNNRSVTSLWDMSKNESLKGLCLENISKLKCLFGIEKAKNLEWFRFGNAVWDSAIIDSYKYFAGTKVRYLSFRGKKIEDNDPSYLAQMPLLEQLDLAWIYTTEQIAWIVANCPNVKGQSLQAVTEFTDLDGTPSVHVAGKGKRRMRIAGNEKKIRRCIDYFDRLVELYRGVPYEEAMKIPVK